MSIGPRSARNIPIWRRGFPFLLGKPRSAVERLRAFTSGRVWRQGSAIRRLVAGGAMAIGWPVVTLADAARLAMRKDVGSTGFLELYSAALTRNVPPNQYARYAKAECFQADQLPDLLLPLDFAGLHALSRERGAAIGDVQDKARFAQVCQDHGLPCVPTIAMFKDGASTGEEALRVRAGAFFVKSLSGNRGVGAERWTPEGQHFVSSAGRALTMEEVIADLRPTNSIVQPALEDRAELRALGAGALSSLRIVTAKGSSIRASVIAAALSLANKADSLTSHAGTLCGIDVQTGRIIVACDFSEDGEPLPIGGDSRLIGFQLSDWAKAVDLVCRAHDEAFPGFVTLGWDVALTSNGPVLLETNLSWNMAMHQTLTGPLGRTRLADVIDELLEPGAAPGYFQGRRPRQDSRSRSPAPQASRDL